MPSPCPHPEPLGFQLADFLLSTLNFPFALVGGAYRQFVVAMSVLLRQKTFRSYLAEQKQPVVSEKEKKHKSKAREARVETACPICQEPVGSKSPEGFAEGWSTLSCGHRFGSYCIKHYLRVVADDRPSCPICRRDAYHSCGHPFLPILLDGDVDDLSMAEGDVSVRIMRTSHCGFCQLGRRGAKDTKRPKTKLRAAGSWLLSLAVSPARLLSRRSRRRRRRNAGSHRSPLLVSWDEDHGPWVDPFPRNRDPEWERWWDGQPPVERS